MAQPAPVKPPRPAGGRLRIGLIGAGDISQYHLAAWRKDARAAAFAIPGVYADAAAMLASEKLDAVDIATWRETHVELAQLAAAHGVHVLCQKPLAPTLGEAEALAAGVAGRVRLMVHENRRFAPHFRAIRRWIDDGRVGPVRQCVLTMHRSGFLKDANGRRPAVERAPFMAREKRLMIAETLIHQLDVLRFLLGPLAITRRLIRRASTPVSRTSSNNYCRACRSRPAPTIICKRLNSSKTRMRWRRFSAAACRDSGTFPCDRA
jgi:predicted dehydrogenase